MSNPKSDSQQPPQSPAGDISKRTQQILEFEWHARALDVLHRTIPKPSVDPLALIVGDAPRNFILTAVRVMMTRKFIYDSGRVDLQRTLKTLRSSVDQSETGALEYLEYLRNCAESVTQNQFTLYRPSDTGDPDNVDDSKGIADYLVKGLFVHADSCKGEHLRSLGPKAISQTMTEHWRRVSEVEVRSEDDSSTHSFAVWDIVLMALDFIESARADGLFITPLPPPLPPLWFEGGLLTMEPATGHGGA